MNIGFIKIHRRIKEWEWYNDPNTFNLFMKLLIESNHETKTWQCKEVKEGQLITSLANLASITGQTICQVRVSLNKLKMTNEITIQATNNYSIITIAKWHEYQDKRQAKGQANNTPNDTPNDKPNVSQIATTKEAKKLRKKELSNDNSKEIFENFWNEYPRKLDRKKSEEIFARIVKTGIEANSIITGAKAYKASCFGTDPKFIKHPSTWLNGKCWENTYSAPVVEKPRTEDEIWADWRERNRMKNPAGG